MEARYVVKNIDSLAIPEEQIKLVEEVKRFIKALKIPAVEGKCLTIEVGGDNEVIARLPILIQKKGMPYSPSLIISYKKGQLVIEEDHDTWEGLAIVKLIDLCNTATRAERGE